MDAGCERYSVEVDAIVNTIGILPIIHLFAVARLKANELSARKRNGVYSSKTGRVSFRTHPHDPREAEPMIIGEHLRALREHQKLSQGDIEERTGLLRCYVSRVENGHTVPTIETLEKWARALNVPLYQVFFEDEDSRPPKPLKIDKSGLWGSEGKDAQYLNQLVRTLGRTKERDRQLLLQMARKLAKRVGSTGI